MAKKRPVDESEIVTHSKTSDNEENNKVLNN